MTGLDHRRAKKRKRFKAKTIYMEILVFSVDRYWMRRSWRRRNDIHRYSTIRTCGVNA